ncbi:MAG: YoaK family protein [Limnobacter sp.]|nr:YoaK family protein [Limnobacter sp.]
MRFIYYSRWLTGRIRHEANNLQLGMWLAFVAGAINAGGFLIVNAYTSHMTGLLSSAADNLALGNLALVLKALLAVLVFFLGAACCSLIVSFMRRRQLDSRYALPVLVESVLLLLFAVLGTFSGLHFSLLYLLCFVMGLQNALITKVSGSVVRTTHVTGMITDLGIEIGKLVYWNRSGGSSDVKVYANRAKLGTLASLVSVFFLGGILGALGFKTFGSLTAAPIALALGALSIVPLFDDLSSKD